MNVVLVLRSVPSLESGDNLSSCSPWVVRLSPFCSECTVGLVIKNSNNSKGPFGVVIERMVIIEKRTDEKQLLLF